jgi:hypothetical protein
VAAACEMPRREAEPTDRYHVFLYASDIEWLNATYGGTIGVSKAVRMMVRGFRRKVEAKAQDIIDEEALETEGPPPTLEGLGL